MAWDGISGKKASQDIPFGKKMGHPGLDCCHANTSEHNGHLSRGQASTFLPHTVPRPLQRKEQNGRNVTLGTCAPASTQNFLKFLVIFLLIFFTFSPPICQIDNKAKGGREYLCWKILVQHDGDVEGGSFTF